MTEKQRGVLRASLERLRAEALASGPVKIEPNRTDASSVGVADEDAQALSEMMQALASERNKTKASILVQIDKALSRMREAPEDFGTCEECEEDIDQRRLALMPYATLCIECQSKRDPKRNVARRKVTDFR